MLSVDEALEKLAEELTPTTEQLRAVEALHALLREQFVSASGDIEAVEVLSVLVVEGEPRPLFAFVFRVRNPVDFLRQGGDLERRLRKTERGGFQVEGSAVVFHPVSGFIAPENRADPWSFGPSLPSLTEDLVGPAAARLGRLVLWAWGTPPERRNVVSIAVAVKFAASASSGLARCLWDVMRSAAPRDLPTIRVDYALRLAREGRVTEAHRQWRALMGIRWPVDVASSATANNDVVASVGMRGLRSIETLQLDLDGMTVLIGENGAGKSTVVEACELLRRMASPAFLEEFNAIHGGLRALLRHGANEVTLMAEVRGVDLPLQYEVRLALEGSGAVISRERLVIGRLDEEAASIDVITRNRARAFAALDKKSRPTPLPQFPEGLVLTSFGSNPPHPAIGRMVAALKAIEVHVPFEVTPAWVGRAHGRQSVLRGSSMIQTATGLERLGINLANAYHALRSDGSEAHWRETMDYVRLGLGERIESVNTRADVAGGAIALWVKLRNRDEQIPAAALSEGTLAYLAFVALFRLPSKRSLLVFDEPELHLHPRLLSRVMSFFQALSERSPVILATHSRRLLDELKDPASAAVLCELDDANVTRLRYPDRAALDAWLEDYEGLGRLLDAGYEAEVMVARGDA